jgi:Na+/H+ antiporter NhaD/arsenite permease-like protein
VLLAAFYLIDRRWAAGERPAPPPQRLRIRGWGNVLLILLTGAVVLAQQATIGGEVSLFGQSVEVMRLAAIGAFLAVTILSATLTPRAIRQANEFSWEPMIEVGKLFLAIFITIEPVLRMLQAGLDGPFAWLLRLTLNGSGDPRPAVYFWLAGTLSAFLDNAPTYLVFFKLAGLHPPAIAADQVLALSALSAGAVFFGGLTYIGNAPNMMLRGVASHRGVRMPGFFGFMAMAAAVLLPVFVLLTVVFFV